MPFTYTSIEYSDMIFIYGFCDGNARAAAQEYRTRYPNRRHPNARIFSRVYIRLREKGTLPGILDTAERITSGDEDEDEDILEMAQQSPAGISTRKLSSRLGVPRTTAWRTLRQCAACNMDKTNAEEEHVNKKQKLDELDEEVIKDVIKEENLTQDDEETRECVNIKMDQTYGDEEHINNKVKLEELDDEMKVEVTEENITEEDEVTRCGEERMNGRVTSPQVSSSTSQTFVLAECRLQSLKNDDDDDDDEAKQHTQHQHTNMEKRKKRKVDSECRQFNDEWKIKYFFVQANDNALCLICRDSVAVLKQYNIRRHCESKHGSSYSHITGAERTKKLESFQHSLHSQQAVFSKKKSENETSTRASYKVAYVLATKGKPFTDGSIIK